MASQFLRFEAYATKASGVRKANIAGIIGEATRASGFAPHIAEPRPPVIIYGVEPSTIPRILADRSAGAVGVVGAPITVRTLMLLNIVVSFPEKWATVFSDTEKSLIYKKWRKANVNYFHKKFGDSLTSIIEHQDEPYPHLHVYVIPLKKHGVFAIETVSKPHAAQLHAQRAGGTRREQRTAFKTAAVALQDDYFVAVSSQFDLDRVGPRRRRLTREEILARAKQEDLEKIAVTAKIDHERRRNAKEIIEKEKMLKIFQDLSMDFLQELSKNNLKIQAREIIQRKINSLNTQTMIPKILDSLSFDFENASLPSSVIK